MSASGELASFLLVPENGSKSQAVQIDHRQELVGKCGGIPSAAKVLELGCGQDNCTIAIADLVSENGSVDGIDHERPGDGKLSESSNGR